MKAKILSVVALVGARFCLAQTPSPAGQSRFQLGQGFDLTLPQSAGTSALTPVSAASPLPPAPQTTPVLSLAPSSPTAPAARDRNSGGATMSYVEGSIWTLTFVKTKPGQTDDYFKSISASLKPAYEEAKKQKVILNYKILSTNVSAEDRDFNVIIMVEYPNMAALESSRGRIEPILNKIIGSATARRDLVTKRQDVRDILATKMMREIWLK